MLNKLPENIELTSNLFLLNYGNFHGKVTNSSVKEWLRTQVHFLKALNTRIVKEKRKSKD